MRLLVVVFVAVGLAACEEEPVVPVLDVPASSIVVVAQAGEDAPPDEKPSTSLGTGWYANVEVDDLDRIHLAWTNADRGDVKYAVTAPGAATPQGSEIVDGEGAVGAYLRLALAPDGTPALSYYHQDKNELRLAHRGPEGWKIEDVAYGDQAGLAGALVVDRRGRPHLLYYVKGDRLRYARRPEGLPGFGGAGVGLFEKLDVDASAGGAARITTDLFVYDDDTVVASYCDYGVVDAVHKLAVRPKGQGAFRAFDASPKRAVEGMSSTILRGADGRVDVATVSATKHQLLLFPLDLANPAPPPDDARRLLLRRAGSSVVRRAPDGTLFVLTRARPDAARREDAALTLYELPGGDASRARRWILERGDAGEPWFDLALRKNGRPVAAWASTETKGLKLYAP